MRPFTFLLLLPLTLAAPAKRDSPSVTIASPAATIVGSSALNIDSFNGIPFAQQPTGSLRLKPPQPLQSSLGTISATGIAKSCPQFFFSTNNSEFPGSVVGELANIPLFQHVTNAGEDCLTLNIRRPAGTKPDAKLPVLVWIFGGGFELGSTTMYDGGPIVSSSVDLDMPVVFVAINYRVGGFGFLAGSEILADGASNLGLLDQRLALEWVADNIEAFGGDPNKTVIWGESAGSISVFDQMAMYDGDINYKGSPLFRGAIMDSGSVVPAEKVDGKKGQEVYDAVVAYAGCSSQKDTLECLRGLEYTDFLNAVNSVPGILSYHSVALSYLPRPDGKVLTQSPDLLAEAGKYASVPFIVGDQEDEGTIFALFQSNITTTDEIVDYLSSIFFYEASRSTLEELVATYKDISEDGSPFRTSNLNNWYPQYKRLAAILGDLTFTITRRIFLSVANKVKPDVPSWSYLSSYDHGTPILGTFHGSDLLQVFYGILPNYASRSIHTYYLSFVYELDPNAKRGEFMEWPQWSEGSELMNFFADKGELIKDDFRNDTYALLQSNIESFYI
ncbi:hypothetical protein ASPWEDRAFT_177744 [Aspergillus wentii DTO 134E9]|uniref:Carboxylesterase type B domain-containing protein n=1 Tax=Aspergillus wentii DTO 134E9 TaxID=1073089 RepID=A0A1L9R551_ASPWE|nr:uncharacterized protein ASPWEDRAFT_177744 [Aspergillus wentii DTO 134E9]OJJ30013.1 hypothetical protein ASPWEDRAFT_177744 [Aspergillus wentii DTO 134E9]